MKKRNFITGFSAAFVATIALVSCGGVRGKDNVVLTINGHEYTAAELFGEQRSAASAEAKFNGVYKAAVRAYFSNNGEGKQYNDEITRETKIKVAGAKEEAKNNASKNGTKYDVEWKKILSTNGVDDETGLYNKFEYELQKTKFEDKFYQYKFKNIGADKYKTNYDILRNGGHLKDINGNEIKQKYVRDDSGQEVLKDIPAINGFFKEKMPYHVKHILVKLASAKQNGDDTNCTISADEANKLYNIAKALANGDSFEDVCKTWSAEDDSARDNHASLGIMTRDTSFVNDFKLGIYLYEALYGGATQTDTTKTEESYKSKNARIQLFGEHTEGTGEESQKTYKNGTAGWYAEQIKTKLQDPTNTAGIGQIPYGVFEMFKKFEDGGVGDLDSKNSTAATNLSKQNVTLSKIKEKNLPRNILFNKYFNKHNIMVITPTDAPTDTTFGDGSNYLEYNQLAEGHYSVTRRNNVTPTGEYSVTTTTTTPYASYKGFNTFATAPKNNDSVSINSTTTQESAKNNVLRDEKGRTILVFRSGSGSSSSTNDEPKGYQGIHFVVIERSPFIGKEYDDGSQPSSGSKKYTTLNEYYTQYYPEEVDGDHPKYDNSTDYKKTYTHWITYGGTKETWKKRSDTVKTELKKADNNLNTYIFDYLMAKGQIKFTTTAKELNIDKDIEKYIDYNKRRATQEETTNNWNSTWETYYKNLMARKESRDDVPGGHSQLMPEYAARTLFDYAKGTGKEIKADKSGTATTISLKDIFDEGGAFNA